jgi:hypothetical protein
MFFLLNDVVLKVQPQELVPPMTARRFSALDMNSVRQLGQELFAEHPRLQHTHPERAERLAMMLLAKAGAVNAALFVAPAQGCPPQHVALRFAYLEFGLMAALVNDQTQGRLTAYAADRQVWQRMAA